jgi:hypothetical protein
MAAEFVKVNLLLTRTYLLAVDLLPAVVVDPEKEEERSMRANEDASVSDEELNTGVHLYGTTLENMLLSKYSYPGSLSSRRKGRKQGFTKLMAGEGTGKAKNATDPTLDFTTLLIAKPLPFQFE